MNHKCQINDFIIIGERANPLNPDWNQWVLVVCKKCRVVKEWQHHSPEQMHGGDLFIEAITTSDYRKHIYGLKMGDVSRILSGKKKIKRYNLYTKEYKEENA